MGKARFGLSVAAEPALPFLGNFAPRFGASDRLLSHQIRQCDRSRHEGCPCPAHELPVACGSLESGTSAWVRDPRVWA